MVATEAPAPLAGIAGGLFGAAEPSQGGGPQQIGVGGNRTRVLLAVTLVGDAAARRREAFPLRSRRSTPGSKPPTGINGLDEVIGGAAGSGKTLQGVQFPVRGTQEYGEPGCC